MLARKNVFKLNGVNVDRSVNFTVFLHFTKFALSNKPSQTIEPLFATFFAGRYPIKDKYGYGVKHNLYHTLIIPHRRQNV